MKTDHLIIVPGLSSPWEENYLAVYGLLIDEAPAFGYQSSEVVLLPGQSDKHGLRQGRLDLPGARERLRTRIDQLESAGQSYRLLGLSFGATVCFAALAEGKPVVHLGKVVAWGPSPLWSSWKAFVAREGRERLARSTTLDDEEFFRTLAPFEYLAAKTMERALVASGDADPYCPPYYSNYLANMLQAAGRKNLDTTIVPGCAHNVKRNEGNWRGYLSALLN